MAKEKTGLTWPEIAVKTEIGATSLANFASGACNLSLMKTFKLCAVLEVAIDLGCGECGSTRKGVDGRCLDCRRQRKQELKSKPNNEELSKSMRYQPWH